MKQKQLKKLESIKGLTLIETMLAIVISLLILASIFVIYKKVSGNSKVYNDIRIASNIAKNINQDYIKSPNFYGLNTQFVIKNNFVPGSHIRNGKIITKLGSNATGTMDIYPVQANDTKKSNGAFFSIEFKQVTSNNCVHAATQGQYKFKGLYINGKQIKPVQSHSNGKNETSKIVNQCQNATNTISFIDGK